MVTAFAKAAQPEEAVLGTSGDNQINQFHEKKQENTRNMVTILSPSKGSKSMTTAIINSTVWLSIVL